MKAPALSPTTWAILAGAAVLGVFLMRQGENVAQGVERVYNDLGGVMTGTVDMASGLLTGNNPVTQGARTDAYEGAGILGTMGAATDRILGGVPSKVGESLGGWLYDVFN